MLKRNRIKKNKGRVRPLFLSILLVIFGLIYGFEWMWLLGVVLISLMVIETIYYNRSFKEDVEKESS